MRARNFAAGMILCVSAAAASDEAPTIRTATAQVQAVETPVPAPHLTRQDWAATGSRYATIAALAETGARPLEQQPAALGRAACEDAPRMAMPGTTRQIVFHVQMLEVSLTRLRNLGADTDCFRGELDQATTLRRVLPSQVGPAGPTPDEPEVAGASDEGRRWVQWLQRRNLAKVLAEPMVVTTIGRRVSLRVGGSLPTRQSIDDDAAAACKVDGVELDLDPLAADDDQVRLEMRLRVHSPHEPRASKVGGDSRLGPCVREFQAKLELPLGTSTLLTGMVQQRTESRQVEGGGTEEVMVDVGQLVVVTPTLIGSCPAPPSGERHAARAAAPK